MPVYIYIILDVCTCKHVYIYMYIYTQLLRKCFAWAAGAFLLGSPTDLKLVSTLQICTVTARTIRTHVERI